VSFPLRCVIDLVPASETEEAAHSRGEKRAWLAEHDYRVVTVSAAEVEADVKQVLEKLSAGVPAERAP